MPTGSVFVVDDDDVARAELSQYLSSSGFMVRAFRSAESFLERRPLSGPACLVLDYHLPGLSGLELQKRLSASAVSVVFVTASGDVSTVVEAMKSGAVDFLTKPVDFAELVTAVTRGLERSERTEEERRLHGVFVERMDRLTRREREVVTGLIRGLANKEIASELGATEKTIKVHRGRVMAKLEVGSVAELVRLVEVMIDAAPRLELQRPFETRGFYSSGPQPKWRSTC
jgi:FixJ family two-component response regulator